MRRWMLGLAFVAAAGGPALADDTRVRTSATVEVLDDKAQIDDVISRVRAPRQPQSDLRAAEVEQAAQELKRERPPAPATTSSDGAHRTVGPEPKEQRPGSRRLNRERNGNPDHTERVRPHRR